MEIRVLPDGEELLGRNGKVALTNPVAGVVVLRMSGNVTADLVPRQIALLDQFRAAAPVATDYYYDLWDLQSYASALRVDLTSWHLKNRLVLRGLHTTTQSRVVKMGVTVANVALGVITQHDDRRSFEIALARGVAEKKSA
jgi:hypothetical protein